MGSEAAPVVGPSFLISQLGHHASGSFADRLAPSGLTPQHAGILRLLASAEGPFTQTTLGHYLGVLPSRLVVLLDQLEEARLVARKSNPVDRRSNHLGLTKRGRDAWERVSTLSDELDESLLAPLSAKQREDLLGVLRILSRAHGLAPGVHPAYRRLTDSED